MRTLAPSLNFRNVLLDCSLLQELESAVIGVLEFSSGLGCKE